MVVFVANEIVYVKTSGNEKTLDEIHLPTPDTVQIISTKILSTLTSVPHMLKNFAKIVTGRCSESELIKKFYQYPHSQTQAPPKVPQLSNLLKDDIEDQTNESTASSEENLNTTSSSSTSSSTPSSTPSSSTSPSVTPQIVVQVNLDSSPSPSPSPPIPHTAIYSFNYDLSSLEPGFILRYASESKKKIDLILIRSIYKHQFSFSKKNVPTVIQTYELFEINEEHDTPYLMTTSTIPPAILSKLIKHEPLPDLQPQAPQQTPQPQKVTTINIDQMTYKQIVQHASSNKKKEANIAAINNLIKQNATSYASSKKGVNGNTYSSLNNAD